MKSKESVIPQYLSEPQLRFVKQHLKDLLRRVRESRGELDLQLRKGSINIYYKGNSLAKIEPQLNNDAFKISVSKQFKFAEAVNAVKPQVEPSKIKVQQGEKEHIVTVASSMAYRVMQAEVTKKLMSNIKQHAYGEEITFEQTLITDNLDRTDLIIIDRQSMPVRRLSGKLDLLALRCQANGRYRFMILEVKLGDNEELSGKVMNQLMTYMQFIETHFEDYAEAYQINYQQKRTLGVLGDDSWPDKIEIENPVEGGLVVGFYSKLAEGKLKELRDSEPEFMNSIQLFWFRNVLTI